MLLQTQVTPHVLDILPPAASQWSIGLSAGDADRLSDLFPQTVLPQSLEKAVPRRRLQYAAGRYCARMAMSGLGIDADVHRGADHLPVWPDTVVGSVSHTDDVAWAAVARKCDSSSLGIDVEQILPTGRALGIHRLVCTPDELERTHGALEHRSLVTLIFSFKESLYKSVFPHVGKFFGYLDARVTSVDVERGAIEARLEKTLSDAFPAGATFTGRFALTDTHVFTTMYLPGVETVQAGGAATMCGSSDGRAS